MRYFYLVLLFASISISQSFLSRLIVPVYIQSEFSYGYDDNYLKLSLDEQSSYNLNYILGDSEQISSAVNKNKISILYIPFFIKNHETKFDFRVSDSQYSSSKLKSYKNYYFKISQHLRPYTWIKFSYSYTPSFYIKSYRESDPYFSTELMSNYFPSIFQSEKIGFELTAPVPYINKTYLTFKTLFESQYYNLEFIEYDLEILSKMCNCRLDKIKIIFPKIEHLFYKEKDKNGKTYLICKQAEEERKEQKLNRKRRSIAGKMGAKKRWSEESLEEDENTRNNTSRRKT